MTSPNTMFFGAILEAEKELYSQKIEGISNSPLFREIRMTLPEYLNKKCMKLVLEIQVWKVNLKRLNSSIFLYVCCKSNKADW